MRAPWRLIAILLLLFLLGPAQGNLGATRWWQGSSLSGFGIDDLKAVVLALAMLLDVICRSVDAALRPLSAIWNDILDLLT